MPSVWDMTLQWGSTMKVSIELPAATRHRCDVTENLLKAMVTPNTHTHTHTHTNAHTQFLFFHKFDIRYFKSRRWKTRLIKNVYVLLSVYMTFHCTLFCLLLGPPGFNCWFSSAPVFQWCCSTPQGSPGVGRNTFLSSPHLCFIIVFICDLFVSRDDPLMS